MSDFGHAFTFIGDHPGLLWHKTLETLALSGAGAGIAVAVGLPLGVLLGHVHRGSFLAINASNVLRALPTLAVIALLLPWLGIGFLTSMVALVAIALPVVLTNAYVAIEGVDADVVDAARGMGMSELEVLARVELPLGVPLTLAGIRTGVVFAIATSPLAGFVGGGGLGDIIVNQPSYGFPGVLGAALVVTAVAFAAELLLAALQRALTPRGVRGHPDAPPIGPPRGGMTAVG